MKVAQELFYSMLSIATRKMFQDHQRIP